MSREPVLVEKHVRLSTERADRLGRLASSKAISEDEIVNRALDILFNLTDILEWRTEQRKRNGEEEIDVRLAMAAEALLPDYSTDGELTAFAALDSEDFYAQG